MMNNWQEKLTGEPAYRVKQIYQAWFQLGLISYDQISTLPTALKEKLQTEPWLTVNLKTMQTSHDNDTHKALLTLVDGNQIETVLMRRINRRIQNQDKEFRYTICISSQVGCAMNCAFCATGKMGFKRNLTFREIIDQYRFWQIYLQENNLGTVDNIVLMGQGEPLANYDEVQTALNILLEYANLGTSKITVSTVGLMPGMERIVNENKFPKVRLAISLHSAIDETRAQLIPTHQPDFFQFLIDWSKKYHAIYSSRTNFIGLEYILLKNINDDDKHLRALTKLASKLGTIRINLIAFNSTSKSANDYVGSDEEVLKKWQEEIMNKGMVCTIRHSQGGDIDAACGQLAMKILN